jgi:6-pyruvoyltetrahydropterin/6-carboxytetrahydropterin synthase
MNNELLLYTAATNFESARQVSVLPEGHKARNLHGHSFLAKVRCELPPKWASFQGAEVEELFAKLKTIVAPLDYSDLNKTLPEPTDENLARWIHKHLDVPGIENIGLQSTESQGVDLDIKGHAHIWRRYQFESAHQLPNVAPGHKCGRMHGHSFEVILHADITLGGNESIGIDYDYIDKLWQPIHAKLDHTCLNDVPGLENPTSELISSWIWAQLKPNFSQLSWVTVYETASCGANFDGSHYRIWKEMSFDSALQLKNAPDGDPRKQIHGHTYVLRLHLHAPIDKVMGWTVDFGDVKEVFDPIFKRLDHHPLYQMDRLDDCDIASLLRWIKAESINDLPQLDRVDLYETRGCGAILSWGPLGPAIPV